MRQPSSMLAVVLLVFTTAFAATACKKNPASMSHEEKVATLSEQGKRLARGWKLDVNASAAANSQAVEKASGIKSDVKLGGDVGKLAQFAAKSYFFGFEKTSLKTVYEESYGEGLLSTATTGWWELDADGARLTLRGAGSDKGKDRVYTIRQLDADKLVLAANDTGVIEVFGPK
ncbi:MAG: hypothetical protein HY908_12775 [Myxococcales bacterium]|nr:hypothetical protein [Myxococcales bacterium]